MSILVSVVVSLLFGLAWGALSSFTNTASSPLGAETSLIMNSGWAWAMVAVIGGWTAHTRPRGALGGIVALLATTTTYYIADSIFRNEAFALYQQELYRWWVVSFVVGPILGIIGATIPRPGIPGLLAGLVVPFGAVVEMVWMPRWGNGLMVSPNMERAKLYVLIAASLCTCLVFSRFFTQLRSRPGRHKSLFESRSSR